MKISSYTIANNKSKTKQLPTTLNEPHLTPSYISSNNAIAPTHIRQNKQNISVKELFSQTRDNSIVFDRKQNQSGSIAVEANTIATRQL